MTVRMRAIATMVGLGLTLSVGIPQQALAQGADGVRHMRRLGGSTRFTPPVRNIEAVRRTFTRANIQTDVGTILKEVGLPQFRDELLRHITQDNLQTITIAPGTRIEWMALRRNGPRTISNL